MRRHRLVATFGVTSLVLFALLGLGLGRTLQTAVERRALEDAVERAGLVGGLAIRPTLLIEEVPTGLSPDRARAVHRALTPALGGTGVIDVKIWNRFGRVLYSQDLGQVGSVEPETTILRSALEGAQRAEIVDVSDSPRPALRRHEQVLRAYVPLRFGTMGPAAGTIRATLPYEPVQQLIDTETRRLYLQLAAGLAVLWAALFRLVTGASRRLREQAAEQQHLARHDPLTGLPNRTLFAERLREALADGDKLAVILMDLDRFKEVNDTLGHHHGDLLLQQLGDRLLETVRPGDTVARLGGDEFAVLLPKVAGEQDALAVGDRVRDSLQAPVVVEGFALDVDVSIGIAVAPEHGTDATTLLQRADVAMYAAKANGEGQIVYEPRLDAHSTKRLALSGELRGALDRGELTLHYQPKVALGSGEVTGVEALLRWQHPVHGLLLPAAFIERVERSDLLGPVTEFVLDAALGQVRAWRDEAGADLDVAVNLSARSLHDPALPSMVHRILRRHGVAPGRLTLELTETTIAAHAEAAAGTLSELAELGVRWAIDDFGTGYSSLALLARLSVHELKVDRAFTCDLLTDPAHAAIVRFTVQLAQSLGLTVVAEGVEDAHTGQALRMMGCDEAQGYGIAYPLPPADLVAWVLARTAAQVVTA
ncbi:MAG: putative bifunctional diguanylate cyclase/phosphodiesterase [Egibacteraceae bacterium]